MSTAVKLVHLTDIQLIPRSDQLYSRDCSCRSDLSLPFHIRIPKELTVLDDLHKPIHTDQSLPPSLHILTERRSENMDQLRFHGECDINYLVRARLIADDHSCIAEVSRPVSFFPALDARPPVCASDFPDEYILAASRKSHTIISSYPRREITIHATEPNPLVISRERSGATTLRLVLTCCQLAKSDGRPTPQRSPQDCFGSIKLFLSSTTFFSILPQTGVPKQTDPLTSSYITKTTKKFLYQERKLRFPSWTQQCDKRGPSGKSVE